MERGFYRLLRVDPEREQDWKSYGKTVLVFSVIFSIVLYAIQRLQGHLFLNPDHLKGVAAAHRAQHRGQLRHEHELAVLRRRVHDVVPDPDGRARGAELRLRSRRHCSARRGRARARAPLGGDARELLGRPLPLARLRAAAAGADPGRDPDLAGRPADVRGHATATTLQGAAQTIARGPVASQIAIKQLGTNGGGYYNSNSAVPFENPNGFTNFLELLSILLIPAAQVFMFGRMVMARRHAWMVFAAMFAVFAIGVTTAMPPSSTARRCCARRA